MHRVSIQRNDVAAAEMWKYVWEATDRLGHNGMSDEEDDEMALQQPDGIVRPTLVRKILKSNWRHRYFVDLYKFLDKVPGVEELVFRLCGKPRIPRVRVEQVSERTPPVHLPASFYSPSYLQKRSKFLIRDLKLSPDPFPLRQIHFQG